MIYTVTLNPSIDYRVHVEALTLGAVNRTQSEGIVAGGKGINVSIVLKNLGLPNSAFGFVAGFTGEEITRLLQKEGIDTAFISLAKGCSRINVKLSEKEETEINGRGPLVTCEDLQKLYSQIECLQKGDFLVLAGSIPDTVPASIYKDILEKVQKKEVGVIVDATNELLLSILPFGPFLIKPNHHELGELFGVKLTTQDEVAYYGKKLQERGAKNVLVSMADKGAVLLTEEGQEIRNRGISGIVKNAVGAGDSMVAGFIAGYTFYGDYEKAFEMGIAAGSASAFSEGLATKEEVAYLIKEMQTTK